MKSENWMWLFACLVLAFCAVGWPVKVLPQGNRSHPSLHIHMKHEWGKKHIYRNDRWNNSSKHLFCSEWEKQNKTWCITDDGRLAMFNILYGYLFIMITYDGFSLSIFILCEIYHIWKLIEPIKTRNIAIEREKTLEILVILVWSFNFSKINDISVYGCEKWESFLFYMIFLSHFEMKILKWHQYIPFDSFCQIG